MEAVLSCNICGCDVVETLDPDCNLCRCAACGYIFDSPRPTLDDVIAFYSGEAKYDSWLEAEKDRDALWKRRLCKLLPHSAPGNLLDVGTGVGQFLHHAESFFRDVQGTEISQSAVLGARKKYGLTLRRGKLEELDFETASFQNITLFHVLEHVPDPTSLMRKCEALLHPGGIVVVTVPNDVLAWTSAIKKAGKRLGLRPFQKFSARLGIAKAGTSREIHLSHFTPAVLRQLLTQTGLEIVEESLDPYYAAHGVGLWTHAVYYGFHRVLRRLFGINRYDTIWIAARKP
jgi:ubiquinone/menaquinone biosynthesis C-methylase UbiE